MNYKRSLLACALFLLLFCLSFLASAQKKGDNRINVSLNRVSISSGGDDPEGFAFALGLNRFISNTLNINLEYRMAHARGKPDFSAQFIEKSVHYFEPKVEYYPFNNLSSKTWRKIVGGLNIGIGASAFIGTVSEETFWISYLDENGVEIDRESRLGFQKIDDIGYVVKLGYEKTITKKTYVGARMDFTSYVGDDGYIGLGVVIGLIL